MTMRSSDAPTEPRSASTVRVRQRRVLAGCAAIGACALLTAACGSAAAPTSGSGGTHSSASSRTTSAAKISLSVSFSGSAGIAPQHYTLRCEPAGGTVSDPAAACASLMKHGASLFGPLPVQMACPMVVADARRVTVSGTYLGRPVHELVADGGCDLSRWAEFGKIFNK
jgi:Subtilisin inhibitor-like